MLVSLLSYGSELQASNISQYAQGNSPKCGLLATTRSQDTGAQQRGDAVRMGERKDHAERHQPHEAVHSVQQDTEGTVPSILQTD